MTTSVDAGSAVLQVVVTDPDGARAARIDEAVLLPQMVRRRPAPGGGIAAPSMLTSALPDGGALVRRQAADAAR